MECYICHRAVPRHEYSRHVGSHLAGNNFMGMNPQPAPEPSHAPFSYDDVDFDPQGPLFAAHPSPSPTWRTPANNHPNAHLVPSWFPATVAPDATTQSSTPPNAFQSWLMNRTHRPAKYTTLDGQKSEPDPQDQGFIQAAQSLRITTKKEVVRIVENFKGFPRDDNKETCLDLVKKAPIFPGLVAYIYTHLIVCPRRGWLSPKDDWSDRVSELKEVVKRWGEYDDIKCILGCNVIKDTLLRILRATKVKPEKHKCNLGLLNVTVVLNHDILNLAALAALSVTGKNNILDQHGVQAERLVELFHDLLEANVELEEWYQRHFFNALILFSRKTGYCPRGTYLLEGTISDLVLANQGGFGYVQKGKVGSRLVAVKVLKRGRRVSSSEYRKQLSKEAIVWRHLHHPNCLPLYGVYSVDEEGITGNISAALVSPWMEQGTLRDYLEREPLANRIQLILDVVRGLDYLHSMQPHVAHRDVKPDNILITSKGRACLADFGLASTFDTGEHFRTATSQVVVAGTHHYMAPEMFNAEDQEAIRNVNKRACDMYALGCTIYAAYTGRDPFEGMDSARVQAKVISNHRPGFPRGKISPDMWSFVENLWHENPSARLTAQDALEWMVFKASQEGVDSSLAPFGEEWEWKGPHDEECLWSVSY